MGRSPCCSKKGLNRGAWIKQEDMILSEYIRIHGDGGWENLPQKAGLNRCGKSCRLRWLNYLRPDIKRGNITSDEEDLIIRLHRLLGNRWSLIAGRLPGRTDNEIKNYWNTQLCKKLQLRNQSQCKSSKQNLETRSKNPSPIQNHVLKTTPINITRAVKHSEIASPANGCSNIENSTFKLCNAARETTNFSKSCCEQLVNDTIRYPDSEPVAFAMADVNLLEAAEVRNSACFMASTLEDEESPQNSDHFAEDTATLAESLLDMNELSSPRCKLLSSPSACSTGFEFEEFFDGAAAETNEFQDMCCDRIKNMQRVNSFTVAEDQVIMEEPYDNTHGNWIYELDY